MSISLRKYQQLKEEADSAKAEKDRARGVLETLKAELKEDFDCNDIVTAKKLLDKLRKKHEELQKVFDADLEAFEKFLEKESK